MSGLNATVNPDTVEGLMRAGNFQVALQKLESQLQDHPEDIEALYLSTVNHRYLKNYPEALRTLQALKLLAPDHSRAMQEQGHILLAQQQPTKALEAYIRYLKPLNPQSIADTRPPSIRWAFVNEETGKQAPPGCGKVIQLPLRESEFEPRPQCIR